MTAFCLRTVRGIPLVIAVAFPLFAIGQEAADLASVYKKALDTHKAGKTIAEFTSVIETCREALGEKPPAADAKKFRTLLARALNRRGELLDKDKKPDEAMADFGEAIKSCPKDYVNRYLLYNNRGISYAKTGDTDRAMEDFNEALKQHPNSPKVLFNRGELWYSLSEYDEAIADYSEVLKLNARDALSYSARGHARYQINDYKGAIADYSRAIQLDDRLAEAYLNRGDAFADHGQYDRAASDYRIALSLDGKSVLAHRSAAWLMATCPAAAYRDAKKALDSAREAIKLAGEEDPALLDTFAAALANAGEYESAQKTVAKAIELAARRNNPSEEIARFQQHLALFEKNRPYRDELRRPGPKTKSKTKPKVKKTPA